MVIKTVYTSKSSFVGEGFKGTYVDESFDRGDMITVVISYLLEMLEVESNAEIFDQLVGTENFTGALLSVFKGTDPEKKTINWMYYFGENPDLTGFDFTSGVVIEPTASALTYPNNWTEKTAAYIDENLNSIIEDILAASGTQGTLSQVLKSKINLYTSENLNKINAAILDLIKDVDSELLSVANVVLGLDLDAIAAYSAPENISSADEFAAELTKILSPVKGLLDWLLFGKDYS